MITANAFEKPELDLCEACARRVECAPDEWSAIEGVPGHTIYVDAMTGVRGFAKAAFENGEIPLAAHEKIAADLAHRIGVPVPGVVLWTRSDGSQFSVSMSAFHQALTWGRVKPSSTLVQNALPQLAAGAVFHTWIDDTDHHGHPGNVIIDASRGEDAPRLAFIDHAYSLSRSWATAKAPLKPLPAYYCHLDSLPREVIVDVVKRVVDVKDSEIAAIVDRIPAAFIDDRRRQVIVNNLTDRKELLSGLFRL